MKELLDNLALPKHVYPKRIIVVFVLICIYFSILVINHLYIEAPNYRQVYYAMANAENAFKNKEYEKAIELYREILIKYSKCKKAKMRIAQSYFSLDSEDSDENFFCIGCQYLKGEKYSKHEIQEIKNYLREEYRDFFVVLIRSMNKDV